MTPDDITTLFAAADEAFPAIIGQQEDHQLHALVKLLTPLLLKIPYDSEKGTHNLVGFIQKEADYVDKYKEKFVRPTRLAAYILKSRRTPTISSAPRAKQFGRPG